MARRPLIRPPATFSPARETSAKLDGRIGTVRFNGLVRCGDLAMSQTSFVELLIGNGIGRNARLEKIAQPLLDWSRLQTVGGAGSPRRQPRVRLSAMRCSKHCCCSIVKYGLSDPGLEEALLDRVSFRRFAAAYRWIWGATPDETTLCRFRNDLKASGSCASRCLPSVSRQFEAAGLTLRSGTLIACHIGGVSAVRSPAPGTTAKGALAESRSPHDLRDANWIPARSKPPAVLRLQGACRCRSRLRPDPQPSGDASQDL